MSTIKEDSTVTTTIPEAADSTALSDLSTADATHLRQLTDGAEGEGEAELDDELRRMEDDATTLQREGMISESDAQEKREQVQRTRKLFRELPPAERAAIIRRRREIGRQLLDRQLSGAAVVATQVRLNHTRMRPLFEQWWPYLNRMSINMQRFGRTAFAAKDQEVVSEWFENQLAALEGYVDEQLQVSSAFRKRTETEMNERGDIVFNPTVTKPSLSLDVEAYSRFSLRLLSVIVKFDHVMDHFDFMVWNGVRDQSDVDEETVRFLRRFHPVGMRGYMTHLRLMTAVRGR